MTPNPGKPRDQAGEVIQTGSAPLRRAEQVAVAVQVVQQVVRGLVQGGLHRLGKDLAPLLLCTGRHICCCAGGRYGGGGGGGLVQRQYAALHLI
jgi:hypothetical protein